ncbi:ATP-dependent DNA helicase [Candidatus Bathyarchaeota archaeon]|nr:MAG: ATP-dependent DNA helicase [Candidatus Bathyarchaeota archaeon]
MTPPIYVCPRCGRRYSLQEYREDRFCRRCGTYLTLERGGTPINEAGDEESSQGVWLPEGYEVRRSQLEFIKEASEALEEGEIFMGSAPCGTGKSLASLLAVLPRLDDGKLLICFRTRSQLHIYLKELRALKRGVMAVSFISKRDMCPMKKASSTYFDFLEECRRLRRNCEFLREPYCRYFLKIQRRRREAERLALDCAKRILSPLETMRRMSRRGFCAYEAMKGVLDRVDVFLGTYHYAFDPRIRSSLLKSLGVDLSDVYLIVDEAHNLPAFSRELLSDQLTETTVEGAIKETEVFEHEDLPSVKDCLEILDEEVFKRAERILGKDDLRRLNPGDLSDLFLERYGVAGPEAAEVLHEYGEEVRETRDRLGYERIFSYNHRVGEFLLNFFEKRAEEYIHLVRKDLRGRVILEVRSLDGREITDPVLRQAKGSILMSGFLSPLNVYRDLMLYQRVGVRLREFESPFPPENRLILAAGDVSSRFERRTEEMLERWREYIEAVLRVNKGNVAVFFTSYDLMHTLLPHVRTERKVVVEQPKTRRRQVIDQLESSGNNVLFGVMGGKFSEGVDYPNNILTCVVAVGLPYATWNVYQRALISYYNRQFPGKGRLYAYLTPAILRLIQACGRVHRSPADKGCIVILDERITHPNIKKQLPRYFQREMKTVMSPRECAQQIKAFWEGFSGNSPVRYLE